MQNMLLYYKYITRVQFLLKYPSKKANDLMKSFLKKILSTKTRNSTRKLILFDGVCFDANSSVP